jgi:hypothetical protein
VPPETLLAFPAVHITYHVLRAHRDSVGLTPDKISTVKLSLFTYFSFCNSRLATKSKYLHVPNDKRLDANIVRVW